MSTVIQVQGRSIDGVPQGANFVTDLPPVGCAQLAAIAGGMANNDSLPAEVQLTMIRIRNMANAAKLALAKPGEYKYNVLPGANLDIEQLNAKAAAFQVDATGTTVQLDVVIAKPQA